MPFLGRQPTPVPLTSSDITDGIIGNTKLDLSANYTFTGTVTSKNGKQIGGLIISNDGTDADHDLVIAPGVARDYSDSATIELTSSITKKIDASWSVGTNQGGLDTGTVGSLNLYGIYLIRRSDTGVVDVLISLDTTPNLATGTKPTNYDQWRLIGVCWSTASSNISPMLQTGDVFEKLDFVHDVSDTSITNLTFETATIRCPSLCEARLQGRAINGTGSGGYGRTLDVRTKGSIKTADEEFAIIGFNGSGSTSGVHADAQHGLLTVLVNADKQIEYCAREHNGDTTVKLGVLSVNMLTRSNP